MATIMAGPHHIHVPRSLHLIVKCVLGLHSILICSAWAPNTNELEAYSPSYDHPVVTKSSALVKTLVDWEDVH